MFVQNGTSKPRVSGPGRDGSPLVLGARPRISFSHLWVRASDGSGSSHRHHRCAARAALAVSALLLAAQAKAWQVNVSGPPVGSFDEAHAVLVDATGNVVAAGFIQPLLGQRNFVVGKFARTDGSELWLRELGSTSQGTQSITLDLAGDVVAAGEVDGEAGAAFTIVKLVGESGAERWRAELVGTSTDASRQNNAALAVAVDPGADIVAAGFTTNAATVAGADFTVIKLRGDSGGELWRYVADGQASFDDEALSVALDPTGDVVAAGFLTNDASGRSDFTIVKLSGATGTEVWRQVLGGDHLSALGFAVVAVDGSGNVFAAGSAPIPGIEGSFTVMKLSGGSGAELWRRDFRGSAGSGLASALVLDSVGDVIAGGYAVNMQDDPINPTGLDFTVIKLTGIAGIEVWEQTLRGASQAGGGQARGIAIDPADDVVAAGELEGLEGSDFAVVKLSGTTGAELWRRIVDGTFNGQFEGDEAVAVRADTSGDVAAAGRTKNEGTGVDFTIVRLVGTDGQLGRTTAFPPCATDTECDDNDLCTQDTCNSSAGCFSLPNASFLECRLTMAQEALRDILSILRTESKSKLGGRRLAKRRIREIAKAIHLLEAALDRGTSAPKQAGKAEGLLAHFKGAVFFGARDGRVDSQIAQRLLALLPCRRLLGAPPLSCSLT